MARPTSPGSNPCPLPDIPAGRPTSPGPIPYPLAETTETGFPTSPGSIPCPFHEAPVGRPTSPGLISYPLPEAAAGRPTSPGSIPYSLPETTDTVCPTSPGLIPYPRAETTHTSRPTSPGSIPCPLAETTHTGRPTSPGSIPYAQAAVDCPTSLGLIPCPIAETTDTSRPTSPGSIPYPLPEVVCHPTSPGPSSCPLSETADAGRPTSPGPNPCPLPEVMAARPTSPGSIPYPLAEPSDTGRPTSPGSNPWPLPETTDTVCPTSPGSNPCPLAETTHTDRPTSPGSIPYAQAAVDCPTSPGLIPCPIAEATNTSPGPFSCPLPEAVASRPTSPGSIPYPLPETTDTSRPTSPGSIPCPLSEAPAGHSRPTSPGSIPCPLPDTPAGHSRPTSPGSIPYPLPDAPAGCSRPTSPGPSPEQQCEKHGESLSEFCVYDLEPVCRQCAADGSHVGHRIYPLAEALDDCKAELRISLIGLQKKLIHLDTKCHSVTETCRQALTHNLVQGQQTEMQIKEEFKRLHQFLREEEGDRLGAVWEEQEARTREMVEKVDSVDQVIQRLEEKIQQTEEEMEAAGEEFLLNFKDTMKRVWRHPPPDSACGPVLDVSKHLGNLRFSIWDKMKHLAPYTPLTLDPRTAHRSLVVSTGLGGVRRDSAGLDVSVPTPDTPERFHPRSCVLARHAYSYGTHCWEIEVGDCDNWTIGVADQSLRRKEAFEACPEAGLWAIGLREGELRALTTPYQPLHPPLDESRPLRRVGVRLDWDRGQLKFCDADSGAYLFSFTHRFTEKVYPYFESTSLDGELVVLPRKVNVTVPSEAPAIQRKPWMARNGSFDKGEIGVAVNGTTTTTTSNGNLSENNGWAGDNHTSTTTTTTTADQKLDTKTPLLSNTEQIHASETNGKTHNTNSKNGGKRNSRRRKKFRVNYHVSLNRALKEGLDKEMPVV